VVFYFFSYVAADFDYVCVHGDGLHFCEAKLNELNTTYEQVFEKLMELEGQQ